MDVLFINTVDFSLINVSPPLGLYSLKNVLCKETKLEVDVINFDYLNKIGKIKYLEKIDDNISMMVDYILLKKAKVVSFYTMCNSYAITLSIAKELKQRSPKTKICFGGPQASLCARESLNYFDFIDVIGIGEGEKYISDLMVRLIEEKSLDNVEGIAFKKENKIIINKCPKLISSEELGNYTVLDYDFELLEGVSYFPIEAGRGCPFGCTFCSTSMFWGRNFRIKPVDTIINEMKIFSEKYGINSFSLEHDMFTVNKEHLKKFCNTIIEEGLPFEWGCSSRIDALDEECMLLMKKANCKKIYMGIETGSQNMQKIINKNLNLDKALKKILLLKKYGFDLTVSFIYGFPDEKINHLRQTMDMIQKLLVNGICDVQLHLFIALPNTYETTKILDKIYFDKSEIEQSVYVANKFNKSLEKMILDYPDVFIQYYTFDSYIRNNFKRLDYLVFSIAVALVTFKFSLRYLLKEVSLIDIYLKYSNYIEDMYDRSNDLSILEDFSGVSRKRIMHEMAIRIMDDIIFKTFDKNVIDIYLFEKEICTYRFSDDREPYIYHSNIDILKAIKEFEVVEKEVYISINKLDNSTINLDYVELSDEVKNIINKENEEYGISSR